VGFIFLVMLAMIIGAFVIEAILPQRAKDRLGAMICWGMMSITMTFLGLSTVGLLIATWFKFIKPLFAA
jgi:hypothetical protein